jgi:hypothetical protein
MNHAFETPHVLPCGAEVTSSPSGVNPTCTSFCLGISGYFRSQTTSPVTARSRRRRWATGTGEDGEAVATATAIRVPSGEKAMRVNRSGPADAGIEGHDPTTFEVRVATSTR